MTATSTGPPGQSDMCETNLQVSSNCLRELTLGNFIVKNEDINLLGIIGEGLFASTDFRKNFISSLTM